MSKSCSTNRYDCEDYLKNTSNWKSDIISNFKTNKDSIRLKI